MGCCNPGRVFEFAPVYRHNSLPGKGPNALINRRLYLARSLARRLHPISWPRGKDALRGCYDRPRSTDIYGYGTSAMTDHLLPAGALVGKYEVLEHIASGGMAEVYKARDPEHDRLVALKLLPEHLADNTTILERFRREARSAARLAHKNIVSVYEWGQEESKYFLAMEYVEGKDLHDYITEKNHLDPQEAW